MFVLQLGAYNNHFHDVAEIEHKAGSFLHNFNIESPAAEKGVKMKVRWCLFHIYWSGQLNPQFPKTKIIEDKNF